MRCATMERGVSVRGVNSSECGGELRGPGRGRRCVAETLVIRSKVRSGAGGLRAARRAHLGPTVTVTRVGSGRVGSAEAELSALSLSGDGGEVVELEPSFSGARTAYTASVGNEVSAVTVSATLADAGTAFEVRVNGVEVEEEDVVSFNPPI